MPQLAIFSLIRAFTVATMLTCQQHITCVQMIVTYTKRVVLDISKKNDRLAHLQQKTRLRLLFRTLKRCHAPQFADLRGRPYKGLSASAVSEVSAAFNDSI